MMVYDRRGLYIKRKKNIKQTSIVTKQKDYVNILLGILLFVIFVLVIIF